VEINARDKDLKIGYLNCSACSISWQATINELSEGMYGNHAGIDLYSDWVDACELLQESEMRRETAAGREGDSEDDDY
jgi:transcription elongation factor Elf1